MSVVLKDFFSIKDYPRVDFETTQISKSEVGDSLDKEMLALQLICDATPEYTDMGLLVDEPVNPTVLFIALINALSATAGYPAGMHR